MRLCETMEGDLKTGGTKKSEKESRTTGNGENTCCALRELRYNSTAVIKESFQHSGNSLIYWVTHLVGENLLLTQLLRHSGSWWAATYWPCTG